MCVAFLIDFFFEYDQVILIEKFRKLTAFIIFLSLFRMTRLSQNIINSITQFVQMIIEIFKKYIVISRCWSFVDDINVKDSRSNYDEKEIFFEVRLFIMEHVQWLNAVLVNIKKTDCTISNEKSQFYIFELKIVDFVCDSNDRFSEIAKIIKILEWFSGRDVSKVRAFINVYVYYRIWVINFIIIASSICCFLKNEESFVWTKAQKNVMNILKLILTTASILLKFLNYSFLTDEIILTVKFQFEEMKCYLVLNQFWNEQKSFFSL